MAKRKITIDVICEIGDIVYLTTDPEQNDRMVVGIVVQPGGAFYQLAMGTEVTEHHEIEISEVKNVVKSLL